MKNIKRLFALVLSIVVCLSCVLLSGCNGQQTKPQKQTNDSTQVDGNDPYAGIEEYEGTTIKFATWIDHTKSEAASVFASFEEKYGIKVEVVPVNQSDYVTKVAGLISSDASPDIVVNNQKMPGVFALLQPLNDISTINLSDEFWDKEILEIGKINDNSYLLNSKFSPQSYMTVVSYNKKLFEDNGFKSPQEYYDEGNWTLATMEECATRIARLGSDYVGLSATPANVAALFGTDLISLENGKYVNNSNNEDLQKAYKWAVSCNEKGIYTYNYMWWKFSQNLVGMEIVNDWLCRSNAAYATNGVDPDIIGYVPLPKLTADSEQLATKHSRSYGIAKGAKNAEAAGYFLRYFLDYENYNEDEMFHSKEGAEIFKELRSMDAKTHINVEADCINSYYGQEIDQPIYKKILGGGSAQFSVNLKMFSSEIQAVVDSCNEIIEDIE